MCIAIGKLNGVELPDAQILKNCWQNNPDGAGFSFNYNGKVYIKKGFMKFKDFIEGLNQADKRYNLKNCSVLIHFRIGTQGGNIPANTHPFPIVGDEGALRKIEYVSDYAVIHNGIITLTSSYSTKNKDAHLSDTMIFIRDYMSLISQNKNWLNKANLALIERLIDSKMAFLDSTGNISYVGNFIEDGDIMYSNTSYSDNYAKYTSYAYGNYENYDYSKDTRKTYAKDLNELTDVILDENEKVSLMKLKSGEIIDFGSMMIYYGDGYEYYSDEFGAIYIEDDYNKLIYIEDGDIIQENGSFVEFREDVVMSRKEMS